MNTTNPTLANYSSGPALMPVSTRLATEESVPQRAFTGCPYGDMWVMTEEKELIHNVNAVSLCY